MDTFVARDFGSQVIFQGRISKHYPDDDNICQVTYTDGDQEDMDVEQVECGSKLYLNNNLIVVMSE